MIRMLIGSKIFGWLIGLAAVAIVYGVINLVFVGGQEIWHSGDKSKLEEMKVSLDNDLKVIKSLETDLDTQSRSLTTQKSNMDRLQQEITRQERFPGSMPPLEYNIYVDNVNNYNRLVNQYNAGFSTYNTKYDDYAKRIDAYNNSVNAANDLAKKAGTTWYLVPIPGRGHIK